MSYQSRGSFSSHLPTPYMAGIVLRSQKWVRQSSLGFVGRLGGPNIGDLYTQG